LQAPKEALAINRSHWLTRPVVSGAEAKQSRPPGRGFGAVNLSQMKRFYLTWPPEQIFQTASEKLAPSSDVSRLAAIFPLPWSHYVRLIGQGAGRAPFLRGRGPALRLDRTAA